MPDRASHYSLNQNQLYLVKLHYKFRFLTAPLLAQIRNISSIASNKQLRTLLDQQYVGIKYEPTYKIDRKPPIYYLTKKAIRLLSSESGISAKALHAMYKNPGVSEAFMRQHLRVVSAYLAIRNSYSERFQIYSKYETSDFDYFPLQKPDLYLHGLSTEGQPSSSFLLYLLPDSLFFITKKLVAALFEHFDEGQWEDQTNEPYPTLLFVCPDGSTEKKLLQHLNEVLDNTGIDDLNVQVTTMKALQSGERAVWTEPQDETRLKCLGDLSTVHSTK